MLKVKSGDLDRMGLLFERHYKQLFGFLFRMTSHREASEDLVQNVFIRMIKYRHTFKGTGEFRTWMYHLARNAVNDHHKSQSKMPTDSNYGEVAEENNSDTEHNEEVLARALNLLTEENREILVLSRYQELKYSEIAQILDISEANVRVKIHRAMAQLKTIYLKIANG